MPYGSPLKKRAPAQMNETGVCGVGRSGVDGIIRNPLRASDGVARHRNAYTCSGSSDSRSE